MVKKIFVLLGHPDTESMCCQFAEAYAAGARKAGHEVRRTNLGDMVFDPILHKGYKVIQELEPDLLKFQEDVRWCEHFVIIYPSWWSTMPALLKGLFDRAWLPGFAYKFLPSGIGWSRLLKGRTGRVFVTSDSPPLLARFLFGDNTNEIQDGILWFAGISTKMKKCGPMKKISPERKAKWIEKFVMWGSKAY
ncbi:MAG TPA: NAD(P)H-dependent oxidoreductase [Candidatus Paceibacterota bacterium]